MPIFFSKFVNVSTTTVAATATFGRLNALVATSNNRLDPFLEFSEISDVIETYGINSAPTKYAQTFFGYSSKTATTPQKLTFYNWRQIAKPASLNSGVLNDLDSCKVDGTLRLQFDGVIKDVSCDLQQASNFSDIANSLNQAIQLAFPMIEAIVNWNTDTNRLMIDYNSATPLSALINEMETFNVYEGEITDTKKMIKPSIKINEPGEFIFTADSLEYTTATASVTVTIYINDDIEIFSREVPAATAGGTFTSINTLSLSTQYNGPYPLTINNIKATINGYTFKNAKVEYIEQDVNDLAVLLKLMPLQGSFTTDYEPSISLDTAINEICEYNGDYVTISFDDSIQIDYNIEGMLHKVISVINSYALNRYYLVTTLSDAAIAFFDTQDGVWDHINSTDSLIITRTKNGLDTSLNAFMQAIIASIDFSAVNGAINVNFIDAKQFATDAITTNKQLDDCNKRRVNTVFQTGGYGQVLTFIGENHIMGSVFKNLSTALGETYIKAQMEVQGMSILSGNNLISLRGKSGQGQVLAVFSSILSNAVTSGIIVQGATLTSAEKMIIINATGIADIVDLVEVNGWYVRIDDITDEHIANKRLPITYAYVANVPTDRIQARSFVIGV